MPAADLTALARVPVGDRPHTVVVGDRGDYRAIALPSPRGDGDVLVLAIPLAQVDDTVMWMLVAQAGVIGAGLVIAGALGLLIVRVTLRPLNRVAATAARVTELPLDRGEVALSVRVPAADTDPRTEVGQVGGALNRMLGHVAAALVARQASETRVRQFVADASHELRTPSLPSAGTPRWPAGAARRCRPTWRTRCAASSRRAPG